MSIVRNQSESATKTIIMSFAIGQQILMRIWRRNGGEGETPTNELGYVKNRMSELRRKRINSWRKTLMDGSREGAFEPTTLPSSAQMAAMIIAW